LSAQPLRLVLLGRVALDPVSTGANAVVVQPKRLALLVWLTLRRPGEFVRRDELLGTFWPDSTEERARASLRQSVRFLRAHLGSDIITKRGDAELGIERDMLTCDAIDFMSAATQRDADRAMQCYGGDLMPGFLLDGAHDFDRWLHAERQRLRTIAVEAALRAATRAEDDGDHGRAAERLEWAQRLEPTDEAVARRLMSALARAGNRAAAVATWETLAQRLRAELDLEPSPQTYELFATIRDAVSGADAATGAAGFGACELSPQRILVLELENRTGDARHNVLASLAAETVARGLADVPDLEVVPPVAVRPAIYNAPRDANAPGVTDAPGVDVADAADPSGLPAALAALARRTGAGTLITGSIDRAAGILWFRTRATDVAGGRLLPGPEPVQVDEASPIEGIELLRERVVTAIAPLLTRRVVHVRPAARPPSVAAYRAYLDGHEQFVQGEWDAAIAHFRHAVELSADYALPRIVSAIALWNLARLRESHATALEADAMRESLGRFERAVLDMVLAWLRGDWVAAHRAVVVQAGMAPGSIPHFQVAQESRRLNHPREAREVLGRLDADDGELRGWIYYWLELSTANHMLRDHTRELEVASRCRHLHPHDPLAALLEIRAFAGLGRDRDVMRVVEQVLVSTSGRKTAAGEILVEAALELRAHGAATAGAALMQRAVEWYRADTRTDASQRRRYARALFHANQLDEARGIFEELAATSAGRVQPVGQHHPHLAAHLDEGFLAAIAAATGDETQLERWCTVLEDLEGPFMYGAQWYWLAVVAAIRNDNDRAVRMLRRAFADGLPMENYVHTDPHLARIAGDERFDAIMRPRG
jgi:DNA-binding SARP family transcriptional activator